MNKQSGTMTVSKDVTLTDIEKELNKVWCNTEGKVGARASLFNLIVFCQGARRTEFFKDMVQKILRKLPCRIIFIEKNDDPTKEYLRTSVSVETTSAHLIACDKIRIEASGQYLARVPFIILPHILPDLPIHLLWGEDPSGDDQVFPMLEKIADRIIFDSECSTNLKQFSCGILDHLQKGHSQLIDMNWARISGWRRIIAQTFHSATHLHHLATATKLTITYNTLTNDTCHHSEVQAIYLQGWVAAQLTWKCLSIQKMKGNIRITCNNGLDDIVIILKPKPCPYLSPGSIASFELEAKDHTCYTFIRQDASRQISVKVESPEKCELPTTLFLSSLERGLYFMKEIFYESTNSHYRHMIQFISQKEWPL